jgi:hypothetical protein
MLELELERNANGIRGGLTVFDGDLCLMQYVDANSFEDVILDKRDLQAVLDLDEDGLFSDFDVKRVCMESLAKWMAPKYGSPETFYGYSDPVGCIGFFWKFEDILNEIDEGDLMFQSWATIEDTTNSLGAMNERSRSALVAFMEKRIQ